MIFWESVQTARKEYLCDMCFQRICKGDGYQRRLWKVAPYRIQVLREHLECPPDAFQEPVEAIVPDYHYQPLPLAA